MQHTHDTVNCCSQRYRLQTHTHKQADLGMKTEGGLRRPPTLHLLLGFSRLVTNTVCAWTFRGKTTTNRLAGMAPPPPVLLLAPLLLLLLLRLLCSCPSSSRKIHGVDKNRGAATAGIGWVHREERWTRRTTQAGTVRLRIKGLRLHSLSRSSPSLRSCARVSVCQRVCV